MFPEAEDAPAEATQLPIHPTVAHLVAGEFFAVHWTTVPEATVHENDNAGFAEQEIRFPEYGLMAPLAGDARREQQFR